jgi:hypothetical protein
MHGMKNKRNIKTYIYHESATYSRMLINKIDVIFTVKINPEWEAAAFNEKKTVLAIKLD